MTQETVFETEQYFGTLAKELKELVWDKPNIYRLTGSKNRVYFTQKDVNTPIKLYNSGTTIIDNYKDASGEEALLKWKINLINQGKDPKEVVKVRQDYGTTLHLAYGTLLMDRNAHKKYKGFKEFMFAMYKEANLPEATFTRFDYLVEEFSKDILSFVTWVKEYNVKPLGVELMVASDVYKVATALDLICTIDTTEKGYFGEISEKTKKPIQSTKTVTKLVIVDFKSGKKGFYAKNVLQLLLSKKIFEENFPNIKVDGIYNLAPKDWRTKPTFDFKNQERDSKQIDFLKAILENVLERGKVEFEEKIKGMSERVINFDFDFDSFDVNNCYKVLDVYEQCAERLAEYRASRLDDLIEEYKIANVEPIEFIKTKFKTSYYGKLTKSKVNNILRTARTLYGLQSTTTKEMGNELFKILKENGNTTEDKTTTQEKNS